MNSATWAVYLLKMLSCDKEIKKRIAMAKAAFMRKRELLIGTISKDLKEMDSESTSMELFMAQRHRHLENLKLLRCGYGAR